MAGENTVFPNVSECEHFRHFNFALYINTLLSELISSHNHIVGGVSVFVCVRLLRVLWYCGKIWAFLGRVLALQTNYHDSDSEREERGVCGYYQWSDTLRNL